MDEHLFRSGKSRVHRLQHGDSVAAIEALPPDTAGVYVRALDDDKALALTRLRLLTAIYQDGNSLLTDIGLRALTVLEQLEALDLTRSHGITDAGLQALVGLQRLEWLALGDCNGITPEAVLVLRRALPRCDIEPASGAGL